MVRITAPTDGQSVCDPFAGVGGFLTSALGYVRESEGRARTVRLFGQELDTSTWAIAKVNLLLHGITDGELQPGDTLASPARRPADGALMRYDRVLTAPPFSMKYDKRRIERAELSRYGEISDRGMADPLIIQHVLSVLEQDGLAALLIPLGVLFRSGAEEYIRRRILEDDCVDAVISLGANFLTATSTPACILVLRSPSEEPDWRREGVIFINAEGEMTRGRTGSRLSPEATEKIVTVFQGRSEVPGFSRVVSTRQIIETDANLSVRSYIEQISSEEAPADAVALLTGRIHKSEIEPEARKFRAFGIETHQLFELRDPDHYVFPPGGYRAKAVDIEALTADRESAFAERCQHWWRHSRFEFESLADGDRLLISRSMLIDSFQHELRYAKILDEYQLRGAFAAWWAARHDDLRTLEAYGFQAVIDRWRASRSASLRLFPGDPRDEVLESLGDDLCRRTHEVVVAERQKLVDIYLLWGERYGTSLLQLERQARKARDRLDDRLRSLGYHDSPGW